MEAMDFSGWSPIALRFYADLERNNNRAWWLEHRAIYDDEVRAPMEFLLQSLQPEFGDAKVFRPNRDVRFSKDKSPYKTAIGAVVGDGYIQLSASGLAVGAGYYAMTSDQIGRYREAVDDERKGEQLRRAIREVEGASTGLRVASSSSLKSTPRGYPKDHPRADLLRWRTVTAWVEWPVEAWLHTPAAEAWVADALRETAPLVDWLKARVGPPEIERAGRPN
jgi:uncharacterized protein (TIGR02453 family)